MRLPGLLFGLGKRMARWAENRMPTNENLMLMLDQPFGWGVESDGPLGRRRVFGGRIGKLRNLGGILTRGGIKFRLVGQRR